MEMRIRAAFAKILWLLPAFIVLALIVGTAVFSWKAPSDGSLWDGEGRIFKVEKESPAEEAGLQVNDLVLSVDGCTPVDGECLFWLYQSSNTVSMTFQRGEQVSVTAVTLQSDLARRAESLSFLLVALAYCALSLIVWLGRPEALETRLFYGLGQVGAAALTTGLFSTRLGVLSQIYTIMLTLLTPLMVHFHLVFPERRPVKSRLLVPGMYLVGIAINLARWLQLPWSSIYYLWLIAGFAASIGLMVAAYVTTESAAARQRIRLVVVGTVVGFFPVGFLSILPLLLTGRMWAPPTFTIPLMLAIPIAYAVALWRYNLMNLDRVLNRSLVYFGVSLILFAAYFAILTFFHTQLPVTTMGRAAVGAAVALVAAVTFQPLRNWLQRGVDRLFYGGWYDYQGLIEDVGDALAATLDQETLVDALVRRVPQAMHLPGAVLWLERGERLEKVGSSGKTDALLDFPDRWQTGGVSVDVNRTILPLVIEDQTVGLWALAARSGEGWGPEDDRILNAIGQQAALAAQNVSLIIALQDKVAEVEDMHRRLLTARENERAELARELHDGVIQDLVGLRYRLEGLPEDEGAGGQVEQIHAHVGTLVDELRRLCSDLRPPALDQLGLAAALQALAREVTARGLPVATHLEDVSLPDRAAIGLYRIGQQALSNALRHAHATRANLTLADNHHEVTLLIADDGQGFDLAAARQKPGCFGLLGMAERAEAFGGYLAVESAAGAGTQVWVRYTLPESGR